MPRTKKERPKSAHKEETEPVFEEVPAYEGTGEFRCPSPRFKEDNPLGDQPEFAECDLRLGVYLEEVQGYLDYLQELEENIKDEADIKQMNSMQDVVGGAVKIHAELCEELQTDLFKAQIFANEEIEKTKLLMLEHELPVKEYNFHPEAQQMLEDYIERERIKKEKEKDPNYDPNYVQPTIKSAAPQTAENQIVCYDSTAAITDTIKNCFNTLVEFHKKIQDFLPEVEEKFGLEQPFEEDKDQPLPILPQTKEDR